MKKNFTYKILLIALFIVILSLCLTSYYKYTSDIFSYVFSRKDAREEVDIPIILYHSITDAISKEGDYRLHTDKFESDLKLIKSKGYTPIFPSQLISYVHYGASLPLKPIIISFDDGYGDNYSLALPLLKEYNMRASISIIGSDSIKSSDDSYREALYSSLTLGEMALMSKTGLIEFVNHSYALHSMDSIRKGADKLNGETLLEYHTVLKNDLPTCNQLIKDVTGKECESFAWPFGAYPLDNSSDIIIKDLGFKLTMCSYQHTSTVKKGDPQSLFYLGRYLRTPSFSLEKILK